MNFDISRYKDYRESNCLEAKSATWSIPNSIWETYSAFANTYGGVILLGIEEQKDGSFISSGLRDSGKLIKDFWNIINNPNKVSANLLTDNSITTYTEENGDEIIAIEIPRAERSLRPVYINNDFFGGTFRRNFDGDYHCTKREVNAMNRDASEETLDMKIIEDISIGELNQETIDSYRRRHRLYSPGHPWEKLPDDQYLVMLGAAARKNGVIYPTTAGLLMFGNEYQIVREFPEYFLDYREYDLSSENDWIDRVYSSTGTWSGNLFDFFYRIIEKLYMRIKIPFKLEMKDHVMTRVNETPVHIAIREALVNCILNADFFIPSGIVILNKPESISLSNPGDIRVGIHEMLSGGVSDVRNKVIMKMFNLLGIGERAGSGVPRILDAWKSQGWLTPEVNENYKFMRTTLILPFAAGTTSKESAIKIGDKESAIKIGDKESAIKIGDKESAIKINDKTTKEGQRMNEILDYLQLKGESGTTEISEAIGLKGSRTRQLLNKMTVEGKIIVSGSNKTRKYSLK